MIADNSLAVRVATSYFQDVERTQGQQQEIEFELHLTRWDGGEDVETFTMGSIDSAWEYAASFVNHPKYKEVACMLNLTYIRKSGQDPEALRQRYKAIKAGG